jgi:hypothetical protein
MQAISLNIRHGGSDRAPRLLQWLTVTNYTTSLDYLKLRAMMMKVLEAFPEAKQRTSPAQSST